MVAASEGGSAKVRRIALLVSRTNFLLSIPLIYFMGAQSHSGF